RREFTVFTVPYVLGALTNSPCFYFLFACLLTVHTYLSRHATISLPILRALFSLFTPSWLYISTHLTCTLLPLTFSFCPIKEYCEEFREIISKSLKKNGFTENGITLVNQHRFTEELPVMSSFIVIASFFSISVPCLILS